MSWAVKRRQTSRAASPSRAWSRARNRGKESVGADVEVIRVIRREGGGWFLPLPLPPGPFAHGRFRRAARPDRCPGKAPRPPARDEVRTQGGSRTAPPTGQKNPISRLIALRAGAPTSSGARTGPPPI